MRLLRAVQCSARHYPTRAETLPLCFFCPAGLANNWSSLQDRAQELLRLKKEMDALKDDLLKTRGVALSSELGDMDQLDERIRLVKVSGEG